MDDSSSMHVNSKGIYFLLRKPRRTTQSSVNCVDINYGLHWMAAIKVGYSNSKKKEWTKWQLKIVAHMTKNTTKLWLAGIIAATEELSYQPCL